MAEIEADLEGIAIIEITDPTSGLDPGTVIDVTIGEIITGPMRDAITTHRTTEGEITIDKTIEIDKIIEGNTSRQRDRSESRDRMRNYSNDSS